jgi:hypothetical protein
LLKILSVRGNSSLLAVLCAAGNIKGMGLYLFHGFDVAEQNFKNAIDTL